MVRALVLSCLAFIGLAVIPLARAEDAPQPPQERYVVLVSVDGLAAGYLDDPKAELPTLRRLIAAGAHAKGMRTTFPSVTWPSHTSLITGTHPAKHGVLGNGVWNRERGRGVTYIGDPELTKDEAIRVETLYDIASKAGYSTASVIWPCANGAKTLNWVIPDSNKPQLHARFTTPGLVEDLAKAGIDIRPLGEWGWAKERSTERDVLYTRVALHLLKEHRINLLLVHLITPDGVEHAYGPYTREAYAAVAESDARIGELWKALQEPPFAGKSTLFVVSDHGFAPYEKLIRPNVALKELGLITTDDGGKVTGRKAWCVAQGGSAFIYLLNDDARTRLAGVRDALAKIEGVSEVLDAEAFGKLGIPAPARNAEAPDLVLTTGPGYSFQDSASGEAVVDAGGYKGTHGHDPRPDYMHATFIAAGAGIKPGTKLDLIHNVDVAPTIAHLLGVQLPHADGQVLKEILEAE